MATAHVLRPELTMFSGPVAGYSARMPDFEDIKKEAESHPQDVDKGIDKLEQLADKEAGGKGEGLIDKAGDEAKRVLGDDQQGGNQ